MLIAVGTGVICGLGYLVNIGLGILDGEILKLADYEAVFPYNATLSGKVYRYDVNEYLLVVTDEQSKKMSGYFVGLYKDDEVIGLASFNSSEYKPFGNYADIGHGRGVDMYCPLGRFGADFTTGGGEIGIYVKGPHAEADLRKNDVEKELIYRQKVILKKK